MTEKRKVTRRKSFLPGMAYFDQNTTSIECLVRDISDTGARLKLPNSQSRSGTVEIAIPINGKHYKGTVKWQRDDEVGIAFTITDTALTNDERDANAGTGQIALSKDNINTSVPVLIVDDSRTMTVIISESVRKLGFTDVEVTHDGHSALDKLRKRKFGLVLSDWEMQPMSGEEFLKEIRQDKNIGKIPIVLITAKAGRGASWLSGASAYLPKPFSESDLQTAIKRAFVLNT